MSFIGVIAFIVALLFSIMVHEAGHYLTAKKFHMKVTEFFLGFGKKLWSITRGETEFGIKAIPAGGYCRIVGMSTREVLDEADAPRAFVRASATKRLIVLGAGSTMHFVLGFLLIFILFFAVGTTVVTPVVGEVAPCVTQIPGKCTAADPASAAKIAGLQTGDRILAINNILVKDWSKAVLQIRNSASKELTMSIQRGNQKLDFTLTPEPIKRNGKIIGIIGLVNKFGTQHDNPVEAMVHAAKLTGTLFSSSITSLISLPSKIPALFRQTFGGEKRDASSLVGVVGVARVSAQTASDTNLTLRERLATFILIIASLNIFVGIFNLLPILPLDGGHMALAGIDGYKRWRARRKGKTPPEPIDVERLVPLTIVVFVILAALSLLLLAADIFNPIHLNV
jgi:membrane-associated protease RseP (regulator of RpoE activity)